MKSLGPWFPFFLDDFQGGTMHMSAAEVGSYVLMLCEQWRSGFVPTNGTCLARISRQRRTRIVAVLGKFEPCGENKIRNAKMHAIREERIAYINEQSRKGRLSAISRGSTAARTVVQPEGQPEGNHPSASASPYPVVPARAHLIFSGELGDLVGKIIAARAEFSGLNPAAVLTCLRNADQLTMRAHVDEFIADAANMLEPPGNPLRMLRAYLRGRNQADKPKGWRATI